MDGDAGADRVEVNRSSGLWEQEHQPTSGGLPSGNTAPKRRGFPRHHGRHRMADVL